MKHLTQKQRYTIEAMHQQGHTQTAIATAIGKHKSTVSRELRRNCDQRNQYYRSDLAQQKCQQRLRGKPKKIRFTHAVRQYVEELLALKYSPEQIVGTAKKAGRPCVSCERIYEVDMGRQKTRRPSLSAFANEGEKIQKKGDYEG